jgi:hypothetical protein
MADRVRLINLIWIAIASASGALSLTASAVDDLNVYRIVGAVVPVVEGASFLALSLWTFYIKPDLLWSPLVWFFAACGVYFGLGPLIYYLGTPESIQFVNNYFPVSYEGLVRTNLLNSIGIGITAVVFGVVRKVLPADQATSPDVDLEQIRAAKRVAWIFLITGLPIQIFLSFPVAIGILDWIPPNAITQIGGFVDLSLIPIYWLGHVTHRAAYKVLFYALIGFELVLAVATLGKFQILLVVTLSGLARLLVKPNFRDFAIAGVVIGVLYIAILQPFVTYGRILLQKNNAQSTFELVSAISGFSSEGRSALSVTQPGVQQWWVRIDYANAELFAMDSFDNGSPGNTINDIPYYFIPRVFYPEKPDLNPGKDFTSRVKGTILGANSTTPCTFGEGYWNLGWLGVIAVSTIMGSLFSLFTWLAQAIISQRRFIYLPLILFGILLGGTPDGWFGLSYIGQTIIILGTAGLLWLIEPLVANNWRSMLLRNAQKSA